MSNQNIESERLKEIDQYAKEFAELIKESKLKDEKEKNRFLERFIFWREKQHRETKEELKEWVEEKIVVSSE